MKIKKIIPLLAVVVVALFALASCDQMLESIYPEQTGQTGTNTLTVQADVHYYYAGYSVGDDIYYGPLTVLLKKDGVTYDKQTTWLNNPYYYNTISSTWTFNNLPDGTYTAYVWIDYNNDGTTNGDYDYGNYWPTSSYYLSASSTDSIYEDVYDFYYQAKSVSQ